MDNNSSPNIVIIVIDAFRPDHMSLFGYKKETDKNLKRIAKESILFSNHFSVANGTAPAVTTILSGLFPSTHGVRHQFPYTKPEEYEKVKNISFWLPTFLKNIGYSTMAFDWLGEWFEKGFDYYKESEIETDKLFVPTKDTIDLAISKISKAKEPFFAFMHLWDTHFPFPNTIYKGKGKDESEKILKSIKNEKQREYVKKRMDSAKLYCIDEIKEKYDLTLKEVDKEIGRFYDYLDSIGILDNTLLVILGDHGDVIADHGIYLANCSLFDCAIKSPLIIKVPNEKEKIIEEYVQNVDIVPTLLDFISKKINIDEKIKLDGESLLPLLVGKEKEHKEMLIFDAFANDVRAVRTKNRKLIIAKDEFCNMCKSSHHHGIEEYDLDKDPGETKNVFSTNSKLLQFVTSSDF
ncbi:MAG: sulfatase [Candidatus Micrarchaeaceae archaeon]